MLHIIIMTLVTLIATALPSVADIYKYRDANGKLVISNQPPPAGAEVESQRPSRRTVSPEGPADGELGLPSEPLVAPRSGPKQPARRPAAEPMLSYVDLHPLELQDTGVERSNVYWKRFVTGIVKNRSGRTTAENVTVRTSCTLSGRPADTGQAYLGTIGPRGAAGFQIPIILDVQQYWKDHRLYTPEIGPVRCSTRVTYDTL
jgi:hypothetical protein